MHLKDMNANINGLNFESMIRSYIDENIYLRN